MEFVVCITHYYFGFKGKVYYHCRDLFNVKLVVYAIWLVPVVINRVRFHHCVIRYVIGYVCRKVNTFINYYISRDYFHYVICVKYMYVYNMLFTKTGFSNFKLLV